jgi:hypothetical protein
MANEDRIDLDKLADTVRETRRRLMALAHPHPGTCVCLHAPSFCDTHFDPSRPGGCVGAALRGEIRRLSDALLAPASSRGAAA